MNLRERGTSFIDQLFAGASVLPIGLVLVNGWGLEELLQRIDSLALTVVIKLKSYYSFDLHPLQ